MENTDDWQNSRQQSLLRVCVCVCVIYPGITHRHNKDDNEPEQWHESFGHAGRKRKKKEKHEINLISRRLKSVSDELYVMSQIVLFFIYVEGERKHAAD